jgi:mRNA interferase MazF
MAVSRGDLLAVVLAGELGKRRPALVVQADAFALLPAVTVLPLTSAVHEEPLLRVTVSPRAENGLRAVSQVMVDKASTVRRGELGGKMGRVDAATLRRVDVALARFLGLAAAA